MSVHRAQMAIVASLFLVLTLGTVHGNIKQCPSSSPCIGCSSKCAQYVCIDVPAGAHDPTLSDNIEMVELGYKGLKELDSLAYRLVFHNNTATYPCGTWCSNVNKLFGFSRGFVPVMDKSCMFGWRKANSSEPAGSIITYGYGWYNASLKPWQTPGQMPEMASLETNKEYIFTLQGHASNCTYNIYDGTTFKPIASASTPMMPKPIGPSYFFSQYFGGTETTTHDTTISYSKDLCCGGKNCPFKQLQDEVIQATSVSDKTTSNIVSK